jgi:hypothetical protein
MDLRRSRWILGVVLASLALVGGLAGADKPNFTEEQKIDFMQHAKVIASEPEKKRKSKTPIHFEGGCFYRMYSIERYRMFQRLEDRI